MIFDIVSILLIFSLLVVKYKFAMLEGIYRVSFVGVIDILSTFIMFLLLILSFIKGSNRRKMIVLPKGRFNYFVAVVSIFVLLLVLVFVFLFDYHKKSLDWDAVALYDARAKFIQAGLNFSDMQRFSEYDDKNKYYYSLYPPYTSVLHYYWHKFFDTFPVSFLYAIFFLIFTAGILSFGIDYVGFVGAVVFVSLVVSNKNVFSISLLEYTNLPFVVFVTFGSLALFKFIKEKNDYLLFLGFMLIGGSVWIRFLEPVWFFVLMSFSISIFSDKRYRLRRFVFLFIIGLFYVLIQYFSWSFFQKFVARSASIFELSVLHVLDSFIGFFTGSLFNIFLFFAKSMGVSFFIFTLVLIGFGRRESREYLFLRLTILLSLLMYFVGMYSMSFIFDWWREMAGSLIRSSAYLVPLSVLLWIYDLKYLLRRYLSGNKKVGNSIKHVISSSLRC